MPRVSVASVLYEIGLLSVRVFTVDLVAASTFRVTYLMLEVRRGSREQCAKKRIIVENMT